jgi:ribose 5-phosphate isomerase B
MTIYLAADHAGYNLKETLKTWLGAEEHEVIDCGASSLNPDDDYPDMIMPCAEKVAAYEDARGIVIGGTGQGEMMAANKVTGIRAALFYGPVMAKTSVDTEGRESDDPYEMVRLARLHNNANVLALSARFMTDDEAKKAVRVFLETDFNEEERHVRRIEKFSAL